MDIKFKNNKLKEYANNDSLAKRKLGTIRAKLYKARLDDLRAAESLEELRHAPGKYHELTHDKKGQWACNLDQPYRLIFVPQENPIPIDEDGKYIWIEIEKVEIIEIKNYHKER
jgi:proteic killer suppression protein